MACLPDAALIIASEVVVDWTKHAFITKFNEIPMGVYQDYTYSLAYDFATTHLDTNVTQFFISYNSVLGNLAVELNLIFL